MLIKSQTRTRVFCVGLKGKSNYPKSAYEYIQSIEPKIILIDGEQLGKFMIEHNVGVSPHKVFEVKRVDLDYFEG